MVGGGVSVSPSWEEVDRKERRGKREDGPAGGQAKGCDSPGRQLGKTSAWCADNRWRTTDATCFHGFALHKRATTNLEEKE